MTEEKEESPYQVYYNMYCEECDDDGCFVKRKKSVNKKLMNSEDNIILNRSDIRDTIVNCAKLRDLVRNYYKD